MRNILGLIIFVSGFAGSAAYGAQVRFANTMDFRSVFSPVLAAATPISPLAPGSSELKIVPGTLSGEKFKDAGGTSYRGYSVKGGALAVSYQYAFTKRLGMTVLGGYEGASGDAPLLINVNGTTLLDAYDGDITQRAIVLMPSLVFDPLGNSAGSFRFPMYAGFGYYNGEDERTITAPIGTDTYEGKLELKTSMLAPVFGLAPAFNIGAFRLNTFIIIMAGSNATTTGQLRNVTTGAVSPASIADDDASNIVGTMGAGIKYQPLGLGYTYSGGSGAKFHSLSWSTSWGRAD